MPDPTRTRPARRTNTRALVGVLLATLLANGVTLGLLLTGQAMPDETTPVPGQAPGPALAQTPAAAVSQDASSGAGATHDMRPVEQVPPASEIPATQADLPGGLQADDTPIPPTAEPINQAAEPAAEPERMTEPARHDPLPPLEFFGIPLFD